MVRKFGEKELTKFFNTEFARVLAPKIRKLGFPIASIEKKLYGKRFDIWFHKRKEGFVIIESEMVGWHDYYNLTKLEDIGILDWRWKRKRPRVVFFQIFSPAYSHGKTRTDEKSYCISFARQLSRKHSNFSYFPLQMRMDPTRFERMVEYFQNSKYAAKQYYGEDLAKEMRKLSWVIAKEVKRLFPLSQ